MEKYNGWIIDENDSSHSESKVVLRAKFFPDIKEFYSLLKKKGVVSTSYEFLSDYYLWKSFNGDINAILKLINDPTRQVHLYYKMQGFARNYKYGLDTQTSKNDFRVYTELINLSTQHQYTTTQQSSAILMIGDYFLRERALKKIKEYIDQNLPRIQPLLISKLKEQKLIPDWVTVF